MALIHVIIPVYNAKKYLRDAVRSVLNQPCKDIEIILVNDGSTDGSADLCDELAAEESRISVIHQKNRGVSAARNTGIEKVLEGGTDGYIAFLDADDAWYPDVFTDELSEKFRTEPKNIVVFDSVHSNAEMTRFSKPYGNTKEEVTEGKTSIWKTNGHFCAILYPCILLKEYRIRFNEQLRYSEDKVFRMQCVYLSERIYFRGECLHIYRKNPSSAMGKTDKITAIDYFSPIIEGWVWSDDFLNDYQDVTGDQIRAGHVLAGIYLMDMAKHHFMQFRPRGEIVSALYAHPHFSLLRDMRPEDVSVKQYKDSRLLLEKPIMFQMKYLLIGFAVQCAKQLRKIPAVARWEESRRYPYSELPQK